MEEGTFANIAIVQQIDKLVFINTYILFMMNYDIVVQFFFVIVDIIII